MSKAQQTSDTCGYVAVDPDTQALSIEQGPIPAPAPGEVLIRVHAAGINRADLLQRAGHYPPPEDASPILGLEVAGTVQALGTEVTGWNIGELRVAAAPVGQCLPIPEDFSFVEGAALPEALLTIWHNVFQRAGLQSGETVLIHGGASGMGTVGVMMCASMGAEVYTTAGTEEKCEALEERGANKAINYKTHDFEEALTELGVANRIDVILDMVGGDYIQKNLNVAAPEGRIVNIAYMQGFKAEVNFAPLLMKRITMTGSTLRAQTFEQKAIMVDEILSRVYPHIESGNVRPVIDSTWPIDQVEEAHGRMQSGEHMGKIVLKMPDS